MEPEYYLELKQVITSIAHDKKESPDGDSRIKELCQMILQCTEVNLLENFSLIRSMHDFMTGEVKGYKEGKAAIRQCYKKVRNLLPNFLKMDPQFDAPTLNAFLNSYPNHESLSKVVNRFLQLFQQNNQSQKVPGGIFSRLLNLDKLDLPLVDKLYQALSKSGRAINDYFMLLSECIDDLQLNGNSLGLHHKHLEHSSSQDTLSNSWDDFEVKPESAAPILDILSEESDGGYSLLKRAKFLLPQRGVFCKHPVLMSIYVLKDLPLSKKIYETVLSTYLEIQKTEREDVLADVIALSDAWKCIDPDLNCYDDLKCRMLRGIATIPPDQRRDVYNHVCSYKNYKYYKRVLEDADIKDNVFIAVYLLLPYMLDLKNEEDFKRLLQESLKEKLGSTSLPLSTRSGLLTEYPI